MLREARLVLAILLLAKLLWLGADHVLRYYMGDSMTYLQSAALLSGTSGRSFLYGWTLRFTAFPWGTPVAAIAVQSLWSLLSCTALFVFLRIALRMPFLWSAIPAWLLAVEPAQIFLERMVMAETLGLLAFVTTFLVMARYIATGDLRWYLLACLGGLASAGFRMNFLPVVLGLGICAPLVCKFACAQVRSGRGWRDLRHVAAALAILAGTHLAYTHAYGRASGYPAGYLADTGMMRIGLVAPLIRPEHFEGTGVPGTILKEVERPLADHWQRGHHIWENDGLWPLLKERSEQPELVARTITRRAMLDDPVGLLAINLETLGGYFDSNRRHWRMLDDKGVIPPQEHDFALIREWTGWDARGVHQLESPARVYFANSGWWLAFCLFALAPLALATAWIGWHAPHRQQYLLLALASLGLVASHLLFAHIVSFRYLHPLPWFVLANVAVLLWHAVNRSRQTHGDLRAADTPAS